LPPKKFIAQIYLPNIGLPIPHVPKLGLPTYLPTYILKFIDLFIYLPNYIYLPTQVKIFIKISIIVPHGNINWPLLDLSGFPLPFDLGTSFVKWFTCGTLVHVTNVIAKDYMHNGNMCTIWSRDAYIDFKVHLKVYDVNTNVMSFVINCHMQLIVHK